MDSTEIEKSVDKALADDGIEYSVVRQGKDRVGEQSHWLVTLTKGTESEAFEFHMGDGHRVYLNADKTRSKVPPPTAASVLHCLVLDAQFGEQTFSDFCAEFGSNGDSIKDRRTYFACQETVTKLRNVGLSVAKYSELLRDY